MIMADKGQGDPAAKTESAPKRYTISRRYKYIAILLLLLAVVIGFWFYIIANRGDPGCRIQIYDNNTLDEINRSPKQISGPNYKCLSLERANTDEARIRGLSGREFIRRDQGMLFDFEEPGRHCIWMKDMRFPIDIIWLDESRKVIKIQEEARPESYPESFCPDEPARFVLEVNAGVSGEMRLSPGSRLDF